LGAPIIAHHGDADAYASGHNLAPSIQPTGPFGWLFAKLPAARERTEPFVADIVVDESMSLHDYGVDAQILFTPGHTPGSISVLTEAGELIAADLIAGRFLGAIRRTPANPPFHHDRAQNLASLSAVLALNPAVLYVGHGGPLDPSRVWRWAEREHRKLARGARRSAPVR
jgi:hydroxyacylglutathione hydrolase